MEKTFEQCSSSLGHQCQMMFEHNSSSLGRQCQMASAENNTSGPVPQSDQASVFMAMTSDHNRSELGIQDHSNEPSSSKLVPKFVPLAVKTATSRQELGLLFHLHIAMLRKTGIYIENTKLENQKISKKNLLDMSLGIDKFTPVSRA
ncbi:hypothetical protein Tco_1396871 [Tanacetum coccineum]